MACPVQSQDFLNGIDLQDFSTEADNTTLLNFRVGDNVVSGQIGGPLFGPNADGEDFISFTVGPGQSVSSITLDAFDPDSNNNSTNTASGFTLGLAGTNQTTGAFTFTDLNNLIDGPIDVSSIGDDLLNTTNVFIPAAGQPAQPVMALGEGDYAIRLSEFSAPAIASYQFTFVFESDVLLGDVNLDLTVDFSDIAPFIAILSGNGFQDEADIDGSGVVDFSDIAPFINLLTGS